MTQSDGHINFDFLYDKAYYGESLYIDHFLNKSLTYRLIKNCCVMPYNRANWGGLFDSSGIYVNGSSFHEGGVWHGKSKERGTNEGLSLSVLAKEQSLDISNIHHEKQTVIFIGTMIGGWGHFITDSMRLLWFIRTHDYIERFSQCKFIYLSGAGFRLDGNHKRMLEILGLDCSRLEPVTELTEYDEVVLPEESFFMTKDSTRFFTQEYADTINIIRDYALANIRPSSSERIYFSYSKYAANRQIGEDKLERYFASKGYEIIHPEELSLDEQLNILANCKSFAATAGSCAHNMMFLKDNTEAIIIPRTNSLTDYSLAIAQMQKLNAVYIDSSFSIFSESQWSGPFLFFISSGLRKYFHDDDTESIISAQDFKIYRKKASGCNYSRWFRWLGRQSSGTPDTYKYYSSIAYEYMNYIFSQTWPCRVRNFLKKIEAAHRKG